MNAYFQRLVGHGAWANHLIARALRNADGGSGKNLTLFAHILAAEAVWLARLEGQDSSPIAVWPEHSLDECMPRIDRNRDAYVEFLRGQGHAELARVVDYRNAQGVPFSTPVADILTHVWTHGVYHRGQINASLRRDGFEPVDVDFIIFHRKGN